MKTDHILKKIILNKIKSYVSLISLPYIPLCIAQYSKYNLEYSDSTKKLFQDENENVRT